MCEDHKMVLNKINKLEETVIRHSEDIAILKEAKAENKVLFETIKDELKEIKEILQERARQLPTMVYSIFGMVIGGSITGGILWIIQNAK